MSKKRSIRGYINSQNSNSEIPSPWVSEPKSRFARYELPISLKLPTGNFRHANAYISSNDAARNVILDPFFFPSLPRSLVFRQ